VLVTITVALAAVAVLAAIVAVAVGGGGELSVEHPDHPPLALPGRRPVGGTDAALLRLPLGLWGYHKQITDEALERFAQELTERDTRIAVLEQELAEARQRLGGGVRDRPQARALTVTRDDGFAMPRAIAGNDRSAARDDRSAARDDRPSGGDAWSAGSDDRSVDAAKTIADDRDAEFGEQPVTRKEDGE
jgi:hypothetical protein